MTKYICCFYSKIVYCCSDEGDVEDTVQGTWFFTLQSEKGSHDVCEMVLIVGMRADVRSGDGDKGGHPQQMT